MGEATQLASKKIIGAPLMLYKLDEVSNTQTLTTSFGKVKAAFVQTIEATTPAYASYTISSNPSAITLFNLQITDMDVLVWGE